MEVEPMDCVASPVGFVPAGACVAADGEAESVPGWDDDGAPAAGAAGDEGVPSSAQAMAGNIKEPSKAMSAIKVNN